MQRCRNSYQAVSLDRKRVVLFQKQQKMKWGGPCPKNRKWGARTQAQVCFLFTETSYDNLSPIIKGRSEMKLRRRERKLAEAEASVEKAMGRFSEFQPKGSQGAKYYAPSNETDATAFGNYFIQSTGGIPMHKANPKPDDITVKIAGGLMAPKWRPPGIQLNLFN